MAGALRLMRARSVSSRGLLALIKRKAAFDNLELYSTPPASDALSSRSFVASKASRSHFPSGIQGDKLGKLDPATRRKVLVNRLLYRSKQRGFLEMDLLVGMWAERHVPEADEATLAAFEIVLDQENPDLFKWLTGQAEAPQTMLQNPAFREYRDMASNGSLYAQALQDSVGKQLRETVQQAARSQPGAEWVRGWDDWKRETLSPSSAKSD